MQSSANPNRENQRISFGKALYEHARTTVYQGKRGQLDVAIKLYTDNSDPSFKDEKSTLIELTALQAPIAKYLDSFTTPTHRYRCLVLELAPFGSLHDHLPTLPEQHFSRFGIMKGATEGLAYLHTHNWLHRDVKPRNLLVFEARPVWTVKWCDFNLSSKMPVKEHFHRGTIPYMAPEVEKRLSCDDKSDVYSLCVLYLAMWLGRDPKQDEIDQAFFPHASNQIDHFTKALIASGLVREPNNRPSTADLLLQMSAMLKDFDELSENLYTAMGALINSVNAITRHAEKIDNNLAGRYFNLKRLDQYTFMSSRNSEKMPGILIEMYQHCFNLITSFTKFVPAITWLNEQKALISEIYSENDAKDLITLLNTLQETCTTLQQILPILLPVVGLIIKNDACEKLKVLCAFHLKSFSFFQRPTIHETATKLSPAVMSPTS